MGNTDQINWPVPPTNPAIMIPGIAEDGSYYPIEKIKAHVRNVHHLALSVFIFSGEELLLQRRAQSKYHCGGLWANTCCSHPHFGEDVADAAMRRIGEELGIQIPLQHQHVLDYQADVGGGLWENEKVHIFRTDVDKDAFKLTLNPDEVSETRWISKNGLLQEITATPEKFTPWLKIYVKRFPDLDFKNH